MFRKLSSKLSPIFQAAKAESSAISCLSDFKCNISNLGPFSSRYLHSSVPCLKRKDRRALTLGVQKKDEGTDGEARVSIDPTQHKKVDIFPTEKTFTQLFNGIPFNKVPICHIRVSKNNTILSITSDGTEVKLLRSCGMEGFKNARKGTNIASQATAISFSMKALDLGFKTIRVKIQGLGPGRMSSVKGLQMAGMDIISITDDTRVSWNPPRARKARRL